MRLRTFLIGTLTALAVISCGGGGGGNFAGGIGGTGVSSGPATAFGSVIVNGVEYDTRSASFSIEGAPAGSGTTGQSKLAVGMVVSVTHDSNGTATTGTAKSVSYSDNVEGPVSSIPTATTFYVLGIKVTVDSLTVYAGGLTAIGDLQINDIVEVSGNITDANNVLATRVEKKNKTCAAGIEVKGTITSIIDANNFSIGALTVNYATGVAPSGLKVGDYVEVESNACPSGVILIASAIQLTKAGPDLSHLDPGEHELEVKGIVAGLTLITQGCTFSVNGQAVKATNQCATLTDGALVEVHGQVDNSGLLIAAGAISNEDSGESVANHFTGIVTVVSHPSPFEGTILVGNSATITVTLNTQFEVEGTQTYNLDTMAASTTCAEVQVNSSNTAVSIHKEDCP